MDPSEASGSPAISLSAIRAEIAGCALAPSWPGALRFLAIAYGALALSLAFAAFVLAHRLYALYPLSWFATGTALMSHFVIGHDCGHRAFTPSRRADRILGTMSFLFIGYPFAAWKYFHDAHHRRTNVLGHTVLDTFEGALDLRFDTAYVPLTREEFAKLRARSPGLSRLYRATRWFPPLVILLTPLALSFMFRSRHLPSRRAELRISRALVLLFTALATVALVRSSGLFGLFHFWILPHAVFCVWFSTYSFLQHTAEELPVFEREQWSPLAGQLGTVNLHLPAWVGFLHSHGDLHLAHHLAPTTPSYHLPRIEEALRHSPFAGHFHEVNFSFAYLARQVRECQLWDAQTHRYVPFTEVDLEA